MEQICMSRLGRYANNGGSLEELTIGGSCMRHAWGCAVARRRSATGERAATETVHAFPNTASIWGALYKYTVLIFPSINDFAAEEKQVQYVPRDRGWCPTDTVLHELQSWAAQRASCAPFAYGTSSMSCHA